MAVSEKTIGYGSAVAKILVDCVQAKRFSAQTVFWGKKDKETIKATALSQEATTPLPNASAFGMPQNETALRHRELSMGEQFLSGKANTLLGGAWHRRVTLGPL